MALKDQKEYKSAATPAATPAFEADPEVGTTVDTTAAEATVAEASVDEQANADVAATKAIAKAATTGTAVGAVRPKLNVAFAGHKDAFDTDTVSALSLATPRITGEQGSLYKNRTTKLGVTVRLEVVSWNYRWALGCGEDKMNDEMKQLFRVSYDNVTVDGEECTVADYIESLKAQGYPKAKVSPYGDLFGYITAIDGKEIPEDERELVLMQLSATSLGNFTAFCVSRGLLESRGTVSPSDFIDISADARTKGSNAFTVMTFKAVK